MLTEHVRFLFVTRFPYDTLVEHVMGLGRSILDSYMLSGGLSALLFHFALFLWLSANAKMMREGTLS